MRARSDRQATQGVISSTTSNFIGSVVCLALQAGLRQSIFMLLTELHTGSSRARVHYELTPIVFLQISIGYPNAFLGRLVSLFLECPLKTLVEGRIERDSTTWFWSLKRVGSRINRPRGLVHRYRLGLSWRCRSRQGLGCSSIKKPR